MNHLVGLLSPALDDVLSRFGEPVIADCGAGKSTLGFVLYELFLAPAGKGTLLALESREDLARAGGDRAAAARLRPAALRGRADRGGRGPATRSTS